MTRLVHLQSDAAADHILEVLARDAAVVIDNAIPGTLVHTVRGELAPYLEAARDGRDQFGGYRTKRIGALMARSPACRELALHPLVNAACAQMLAPFCDGYQLHFTQGVSIGPAESAQALHRDRGVWGGYIPRRIETQFSTIWAINDFTEENGATQVVPGSHLWDRDREAQPHEIVPAEMSAGSVLLYTGTVIHGGGANRSRTNRLGVLLHYTLNWLRQEENQYLSCPPDIAKALTPELRALMGYAKGGYVLGFYSSPGAPGEGPELAPPESLFGDKPGRFSRTMTADALLRETS